VQQATGDASRFNQLVSAYEKAPGVTRERLYIETLENVLGRSRKVIIDAKDGNGNVLYLPLDKLLERSRNDSAGSITVRPPATVEPEPSSATDGRQRVER
jgi:membrane protease subunit HflK